MAVGRWLVTLIHHDSSQPSCNVSGGAVRSGILWRSSTLKGPCVMYHSGCYHLRSSALTACLRPLSFSPLVTLPVRFRQGRFNSDCDSCNWGAWLRGACVRTSMSSPSHSVRVLFDYTTLHVSRTAMSQFVALLLHRNTSAFT